MQGTLSESCFVITRTFDAPLDLVWTAWTDSVSLGAWLGPKGMQAHVIQHDLRPGGSLHTCFTTPGGPTVWGKFAYREIVPPSLLVWEHSFADEAGQIVRHPFSPTWPLKMLTTVNFENAGDKAKVTLTWCPMDATEIEDKTFVAGMEGMKTGWGGSFDSLADFLAKK